MNGIAAALILGSILPPQDPRVEKVLADFEDAQIAAWETTLKGTKRKESQSRSGGPVVELETPGGLYGYTPWRIHKGAGQGGGNAVGIGYAYTTELVQYKPKIDLPPDAQAPYGVFS